MPYFRRSAVSLRPHFFRLVLPFNSSHCQAGQGQALEFRTLCSEEMTFSPPRFLLPETEMLPENRDYTRDSGFLRMDPKEAPTKVAVEVQSASSLWL